MNPAQKPLTMKNFRAEIVRRRRMRLPTKIYHSLICGDREVVRHGARWRLDYAELIERAIIKKSCFQRGTTEYFFSESAKRGCATFLDIGANIGYFSVIGARMGIFKRIHAIEPTPKTFAKLQWHIRVNGFEKLIHAHQIAASDSAREVALWNPAAHNCGATEVTELADAEKMDAFALARALPLDSFLPITGENLAVKMDIQGHEISALIGGKNCFQSNRVFLMVEVVDGNAAVVNYLCANGFRMVAYQGGDFFFENTV